MSAGRAAGRDHALPGMLMADAGGRPVNLAWVGLGFALIDAGSIARPLLEDARERHGNLFYGLIGLTCFRITCSQRPQVKANDLMPTGNVRRARARQFMRLLKGLH